MYLVLIDYCHPPHARHFGIGLECQDRRRKERRLDRAFRSYEKAERGSRQPAVPGRKKARSRRVKKWMPRVHDGRFSLYGFMCYAAAVVHRSGVRVHELPPVWIGYNQLW